MPLQGRGNEHMPRRFLTYLAGNRQVNAELAQMVPLPARLGAACWEWMVLGGLWPPEPHLPRMPTFFRHLDAALRWVGPETVTCKALGS